MWHENGNQIAKYVGGNFSFLKLPEAKTVMVNSEAIMNGNHAVPQLYQNTNKVFTRINALDMQNTSCEGEGAAVGFIVCNHLLENFMVVSNDTDVLFYCMIAANKRNWVNNEFSHKFWLEILYTSNDTGLTGSQNNRISEYWNINEIIYSIEHLLPNIGNPVLSLIVLYLSAGSELTEKWFGKTHATFIKKYMAHSDFIGDLINSRNIRTLNSNSYRNLNDCLDCRKHRPNKNFIRWIKKANPKEENLRSRLPNETTIFQTFRRVLGAYKYMLSYSDNVMEEIDWKNFGFEYNDETKSYYPIIINDTFLPIKNNTLINNAKVSTQKRIKTTKMEDQLTALNKQFQTSSYLDGSSLKKLITETKLTKTQIQYWFSRKWRANNDNDNKKKLDLQR